MGIKINLKTGYPANGIEFGSLEAGKAAAKAGGLPFWSSRLQVKGSR